MSSLRPAAHSAFRRLWFLLLATALLGVGCGEDGGPELQPAPGPEDAAVGGDTGAALSSNALRVSTRADHSGASTLHGSTLRGPVAIFLELGAESSPEHVEFYVDNPERDGEPVRSVIGAPYDLASPGPDGKAALFDTAQLADGAHSVTVSVHYTSGQLETATAHFTVANADGDGDAGITPPAPDAGTPKPDAGAPKPDAGAPKPDAGTPTPDAGTPKPDAGTPKPDAGTPTPDAGAPTPDAGTPVPTDPVPPAPAGLRSVAQWESLFQGVWGGEHTGSFLAQSTSLDSWQFYGLAYGIDGNTAMYRATGKAQYLDRALLYVNNMVANAKPSSQLGGSAWGDAYYGWTSQRSDTLGQEVPLFESYAWRYVTRLLRVIHDTPALYGNATYRAQYDKLLAFSEKHMFEKWYRRGVNSYIYRVNTPDALTVYDDKGISRWAAQVSLRYKF